MLSRFKGCLVGAVVADCIGARFEGHKVVKNKYVLEEVTNIERNRQQQREKGTCPADVYGCWFTDDTAMARSVASSLLEKNQFDAQDMGKRFTESYFDEPDRGYGGNITTVFKALRETEYKDVFKPAAEQFDGSGSYGNGGAMRIAPASLFAYFDSNTSDLMSLVSSITRLTHTHHLAIQGAQLQALAIDQCLRLDPSQDLNAGQFIDDLIAKLKPVEEERAADSSKPPPAKQTKHLRPLEKGSLPYCAKLGRIKEYLGRESLRTDEVVEQLGNDVSALGSVPAAILAFLRAATHNLPQFEGRSKFEQTVLYAISLGGDTDTIATMAAAMAGALYGMDQIPEAWQYYCEGVADAEIMAEKLHQRGTENTQSSS